MTRKPQHETVQMYLFLQLVEGVTEHEISFIHVRELVGHRIIKGRVCPGHPALYRHDGVSHGSRGGNPGTSTLPPESGSGSKPRCTWQCMLLTAHDCVKKTTPSLSHCLATSNAHGRNLS
ncbi:hypothetical protein NL676_022088 [Syzygium grande]|nr:hypothetical protein NL676_022088 [Syzygium grande]